MGGCELRLQDAGVAHFSYWVFPAHRGRGYAARGLGLIVRYAAEHLGVSRAELHIDPENAASLGVARRAGFRVEGSDERGELIAVKELG